LRTGTLDNAITSYFEKLDRCDSLFGATRFQARFYWADGRPVNHNPAELIRTQELQPLFLENSNMYIFSKDSFRRAGDRRIGLTPQVFEIDYMESVDIDEVRDFAFAESLWKIRCSGQDA
jgi:CMP-N-acetylneuraminic acid synthetase